MSLLQINGTLVRFKTQYFGTYQAVITKTLVTKVAEAPATPLSNLKSFVRYVRGAAASGLPVVASLVPGTAAASDVKAAVAALPEVLIRSSDGQVAFQTSMVVQLLGVIVAAIALAAASSVLGLGLVRLATRPWRHRPSTFVAWSFLRAPRVVQPVPVRLWQGLRRAVDASATGELPPRTWAPVGLLVLCVGGAGWLLSRALGPSGAAAIGARNGGIALALHGFLLVSGLLPGRWPRLLLQPQQTRDCLVP